jgi:hypothetical protein
MGARWPQENQFRFGRIHLGLDAHDSYAAGADDPDRSVPNPAKNRPRKTCTPPKRGSSANGPAPTRPYSSPAPPPTDRAESW